MSENWFVISEVGAMKALTREWHAQGLTVALVPTMGALHEGHLSLVHLALKHCDRVVTSVFVNPTQFGPTEDFNRYPRDLDGDLQKLKNAGAHGVFSPSTREMYPEGFQTGVELSRLPGHLCGLTRTGHFAGVAQVVLKLFNICMPDVAVFGQKDFQQVRIIEQMVSDLNLDVKIVRHPIVREEGGLAMSSRNVYLTPQQRAGACSINRALDAAERDILAGARDSRRLIQSAIAAIVAQGGDVEYFNICDPATLDDLDEIGSSGEVLLVTAVRFGYTRLIDNHLVRVG